MLFWQTLIVPFHSPFKFVSILTHRAGIAFHVTHRAGIAFHVAIEIAIDIAFRIAFHIAF